MKYQNKDEYDGQWKRERKHGEGVFKKASTGRVERRLYIKDKVIEVLEVIEEGRWTSSKKEFDQSTQLRALTTFKLDNI